MDTHVGGLKSGWGELPLLPVLMGVKGPSKSLASSPNEIGNG
jgi:hypothetical protein